MRSIANGTAAYYVGNYYEKTGNTVTKYYYFAGKRVAMRDYTTLYWLLTDHLGSTAITAKSDGTVHAELRYKPFGVTRYTSGTTPTTFKFTGQREESGLSLYYYVARWYDPSFARFAQADTIVPEPGNSQSLNRYSYVLNCPTGRLDPTGHFSAEEIQAHFGTQTWDDVLRHFQAGGDLEALWAWLAALRAAEYGDAIVFHDEIESFPAPHPVLNANSRTWVFVEFSGGIGLAWDKPGYRDHPVNANAVASGAEWAACELGGRGLFWRARRANTELISPGMRPRCTGPMSTRTSSGLPLARWARSRRCHLLPGT